jgi:hypothetical protein
MRSSPSSWLVNRNGPSIQVPVKLSRVVYPRDPSGIVELTDDDSKHNGNAVAYINIGPKGLVAVVSVSAVTLYYWISFLLALLNGVRSIKTW